MVRRIVGGLVLLGVLWGLGSWAGDSNPMPSHAWWVSVQDKVKGLTGFAGETARDKIPQNGFDVPPLDSLMPATAAPAAAVTQ